MRKYVCVLATDNYLNGCLVLNENLKHLHSKHDLLCIINEEISQETKNLLDYFHIEYKMANKINYDVDFTGFVQPYFKNTFDKLSVFNLIEYEKIVYLDLDLLILENIDNLFDYNAIAMAKDTPYTEKYNSGVMVIEPNKEDFVGLQNLMLEKMQQQEQLSDQDIINEYFQMINTLPQSYNLMRRIDYNIVKTKTANNEEIIIHPLRCFYNTEEKKILHYIVNPKPFHIEHPYQEIYSYLYSYYMSIIHEKKEKFYQSNLKDLAIVVSSCDKNEEVWPIFKKCMDKYWENHPTIYLLTETKKCDYMNTINYNFDLNHWTNRIRKSLNDIKEDNILFICDDCFLDKKVNAEKLIESIEILNKGYSCIQLELSVDPNDIESPYSGYKEKTNQSQFYISILCGLWKKDKLIDILREDSSPWDVEKKQWKVNKDEYYKGHKVLQVCDEKVISWFNDRLYGNGAIRSGKWQNEVIDFFKSENIEVDFSKKGFYS